MPASTCARTPRPRSTARYRSGEVVPMYCTLTGTPGIHRIFLASCHALRPVAAPVRRARRPRRGRPARRRGRGGGLARPVRLGPHPLARARRARWPTRGSRSPPRPTVTERLLLGPMVTPLARRRPAKVARETVTLDRLSGGRLVLGVGLGSDRFGREFSGTGEECDDRRRAAMLDEHLTVLDAAWSGAPVQHRGEHYVLDGLTFRPARPIRCGRPGSPDTPGRCAAPRPATASSPSTWRTPTSWPRSPRRSTSCAAARPAPSTWSSACRRARTSPRSRRPARPGG